VRTLALEPVGGIAGDMLLAALLHLGAPRAALDDGLRRLGLGIEVSAHEVSVSGIRGLRVEVRVAAEGHVHRPWREIRSIIDRAGLPAGAARRAQEAFALLARAEGTIHGVAAEEVEFHEVGSIDSIADIVGAAILVEALRIERIVALPPPAGSGTIHSAHGPIPLPAPATLELLRGRTLRPSGPGERTTPTGAAVLAAWTEESPALPEMTVEAVGYGAGTKRWEDAPNLLRAVLGESAGRSEAAWVLETNLDDLSPQLAAVALEAALAAGALDAWIAPVTMKKGRPGHLFGALCAEASRAAVEQAIFRETTTLGIRAHPVTRSVLDRELVAVATPYGAIRMKLGRSHGRLLNAQPEFDDCRQAAERHGVPVKEVQAAALSAFRSA
jgi:pyridinium-3,5-bisthiocarboxylic acid mononucleotide nickel chelatase